MGVHCHAGRVMGVLCKWSDVSRETAMGLYMSCLVVYSNDGMGSDVMHMWSDIAGLHCQHENTNVVAFN